ncbi:SpoIIE family protein phosphatase [Modestobacter sp. I12A-02628]|uniref:protein-serine/threonine phosphatase n=1 Tax=Goekera deserti TaxID=2497753 RepID=A0A7K3WHH5_9ACTN|nr:SpoIIE family protein phosphatase [Goekera deserti]MPR00401.1 SpoIIE family protein phosphatase [Goekera deserti]NDI50395.1 SpoIIE family protein phosphatase [Goekera deserti]NEL55339.1 SpoIIE family protein phosphatase [Goekera deserti]
MTESPPAPPSPSTPAQDRDRLAVARRLEPAEETSPTLDALSELAARLMRVRAAHVCLLTDAEAIAGRSLTTPAGHRPLDDSICRLALDGEIVVPDARADARTAGVSLVAEGLIGSFLGTPLVVDDDLVVGTFCVFDPEPRPWTDDDRETLRLLGQAAVVELQHAELAVEYERTRLRWGLAIEAAEIGSFDWDLQSGVLAWDDRLIELFGYDAATFDRSIEGFNDRVHPADLPRVSAAIARSIAGGEDLEMEYRVVLPTGVTRWVRARGKPLYDAAGVPVRLLGAAQDSTDQRDREALVGRVLEAMPSAMVSVDRRWRFTYLNAEAERVLGRPRAELLGGALGELFPAGVGTPFEAGFRRAMETGEPQTLEAYHPAPLDVWLEVRAWSTPEGLSFVLRDVTERRRTQELAARQAQRLELLAQVGAELSGTVDGAAVIGRLARLVVPALADGCVVTVVDSSGRVRDVGTWHADPGHRAALERYGRARVHARPSSPGAGVGVVDRAVGAWTPDLPPAAGRLLAEVDVGHVLALPMRGHSSDTGLLSLLYAPGRLPTDEERQTAQDVADRTGLALDQAQVFGRQRLLAEGLQRSLLTEPPEPDDLEVVVRYEPAAEQAQVGGDWYDAFLQPGGSMMLVIGDVAGHDTQAAAAMGQLRSLLRGVAVYSDAGPAEVLRGLDRAVQVLDVPALATVAVARFEQTDEEVARGVTRLVWSNAGHPPPVVIEPDGTLRLLGGLTGELLLGVDPDTRRTEHSVVLARGSTVVLYTDGLVERRDADLDHGLAVLTDELTRLAHLPLDQLCDQLLDHLLQGRPDDDVALVAVRLHPQRDG